jgi:transcriptional regulator with XRE-family HTH domain
MNERQLKEFGIRVRRRREALNLTRQAFCVAAGINRTTLRQLEAGVQDPTQRTLDRLVKALQVPDEAALTGAEPIRLDHPLVKDLRQEDLDVAHRFHHATTPIRNRILDLLRQVPDSVYRTESAEAVLTDRRRAPAPIEIEHEASAATDPRVAPALAELDPTTRQTLVELILRLAKDSPRDVESLRHRKADTTQRSKRR